MVFRLFRLGLAPSDIDMALMLQPGTVARLVVKAWKAGMDEEVDGCSTNGSVSTRADRA